MSVNTMNIETDLMEKILKEKEKVEKENEKLKKQLKEKDNKIEDLKREIRSMDYGICRLNDIIDDQEEYIEDLEYKLDWYDWLV